jgi:voltage-gated potassium channel
VSGGNAAFAKVLDVILAAYSVVVFAALAATLGAYFLERQSSMSPDPTPLTTAPPH